jgi:hypothetical protein
MDMNHEDTHENAATSITSLNFALTAKTKTAAISWLMLTIVLTGGLVYCTALFVQKYQDFATTTVIKVAFVI